MNVLDTSYAITCSNFRVVVSKVISPAESAHLLLLIFWNFFNMTSLLELFVFAVRLNVEVLLRRPKLPDFELDSSYLDYIIALYSQTIRFEGSNDSPQSVVGVSGGPDLEFFIILDDAEERGTAFLKL